MKSLADEMLEYENSAPPVEEDTEGQKVDSLPTIKRNPIVDSALVQGRLMDDSIYFNPRTMMVDTQTSDPIKSARPKNTTDLSPDQKYVQSFIDDRNMVAEKSYFKYVEEEYEKELATGVSPLLATERATKKATLRAQVDGDKQALRRMGQELKGYGLPEVVVGVGKKVLAGASLGGSRNFMQTLSPLDAYQQSMPPDVYEHYKKVDPDIVKNLRVNMGLNVAAEVTGDVPVVQKMVFGWAAKGAKALTRAARTGAGMAGMSAIQGTIDPTAVVELSELGKSFVIGAMLPLANKIPGIGKIESSNSKLEAAAKMFGQTTAVGANTAVASWLKEALNGRDMTELPSNEQEAIYANIALMMGLHLWGGKSYLLKKYGKSVELPSTKTGIETEQVGGEAGGIEVTPKKDDVLPEVKPIEQESVKTEQSKEELQKILDEETARQDEALTRDFEESDLTDLGKIEPVVETPKVEVKDGAAEQKPVDPTDVFNGRRPPKFENIKDALNWYEKEGNRIEGEIKRLETKDVLTPEDEAVISKLEKRLDEIDSKYDKLYSTEDELKKYESNKNLDSDAFLKSYKKLNEDVDRLSKSENVLAFVKTHNNRVINAAKDLPVEQQKKFIDEQSLTTEKAAREMLSQDINYVEDVRKRSYGTSQEYKSATKKLISGLKDILGNESGQVQIPGGKDEEKVALNTPKERYYSTVSRGIDNIAQNKATGQQWLNMIKKQAGVSQREIEYMGLERELGKKPMWMKSELKEFAEKNKLEVKVRKYGDNKFGGYTLRDKRIKDVTKQAEKLKVSIEDVVRERFTKEEQDRLKEIQSIRSQGDGTYELHQEFSNLIESKLKGVDPELARNVNNYMASGFNMDGITTELQLTSPKGYQERLYTIPKKAHDNRLVRVDDEKNYNKLFPKLMKVIEKVEPDAADVWAQSPLREGETFDLADAMKSAREAFNEYDDMMKEDAEINGTDYKIPDRTDALKKMDEELKSIYDNLPVNDYISSHFPKAKNVGFHTRVTSRRHEGKKVRMLEELQSDMTKQKIPNALSKDWYQVGLKNELREAINRGDEYLAWTTGKQQADRYGLDRNIDNLIYRITKNGKIEVAGETWHEDSEPHIAYHETITPEQFKRRFGDEVYKDVVTNWGDRVRESDDMSFSGAANAENLANSTTYKMKNSFVDKSKSEFARELYDKIVPSFLKDYLKSYSVKVEDIDVGVEQGDVHSIRITPEMVKDMKGKPVPIHGMGVPEAKTEVDRILKSHADRQKPKTFSEKLKGSTSEEDKTQATLMSKIGDEIKGLLSNESGEVRLPNAGETKEFKRSWYDRFTDLYEKQGVYKEARKLQGKIMGRASDILGKFYNEDLKDVTGKDIPILNRIYKLNAQMHWDRAGRTTEGVTEKVALDALGHIRQRIGDKEYDRLSGVVNKVAERHNNELLNVLIEGEVITPKTAEWFRKTFPVYLQTQFLDDAMTNQASGGGAIGRYNKSFLQTKVGTEEKISDDLLELTKQSIISKVNAAEKQKLVNNIGAEFGEKVGIIIHAPGGKSIHNAGMVPMAHESMGDMNSRIPDAEQIKWIREKFAKKLKSEFEHDPTDEEIQDNVRINYTVPKDIMDMMKGVHNENIDIITRAIGGYNTLFKMAATTWRLPFTINNAARDIQNAVFLDRVQGAKISRIGGIGRGFAEAVKESMGFDSDWMKRYKLAGGGMGGVYTSLGKEVPLPRRLLVGKDKVVRDAKNAILMPLNLMGKLAEISENTTRVGHFIRANSAGLGDAESAFLARDLTVDFQKYGNKMKVANTYIPFLNASVQGNINYARFVKDHPKVAAARVTAMVLAPYVALKTWNAMFDEDEGIEDYLKNGYWYAIMPDMEALSNGEFKAKSIKTDDGETLPVLITVRKPEFASMLTSAIDPVVNYNMKKQKGWSETNRKITAGKLLGDMSKGAAGMVTGITPPLLSTSQEIASNYKMWSKSPIVPPSRETVQPKYQSASNTTNIPRRIGEAVNVSPAKVEYAMTSLIPATSQLLTLASPLFKSDKGGAQNYAISSSNLEKVSRFIPLVKTSRLRNAESATYDWKKEDQQSKLTANMLYKDIMGQMMRAKTPVDNEKIDADLDNLFTNYSKYVTGESLGRLRDNYRKSLKTTGLKGPDKVIGTMDSKQQRRFYMGD